MGLGRCVTDSRMIILEADEGFADILQLSCASLPGRSIYDLTHPDDLPTNRQLLDDLRQNGVSFSITKRYLLASKSVAWVNNHVGPAPGRSAATNVIATIERIEAPMIEISDRLLLLAAKDILQKRAVRPKFFGELSGADPDFDILIDLYANQMQMRTVSITSACIAANVPMTTALRHIGQLVEQGWIERTDDPRDKRRSTLSLSNGSMLKVQRYLAECVRN